MKVIGIKMHVNISNTLQEILLLLLVILIYTTPLHAEEGRLMDTYPPDFAAENFKLPDLAGDIHELRNFRGKYVLINFWTMSCNICKSEMTTLQSALELLNSDKLEVISIHAGNNYEGVESVLKLNDIEYPVLFDTDLQLGGWGVPVLPTTFLVDPKGDIRYRAVGTRVWNSPFMIDFMQSILDSDGSQASSAKPL
jgi:peroxiredoxin